MPSLEGIQVMRAVAAIAVVFTHSITRVSVSINSNPESSFFKSADGNQWIVGDFGVDLFFVISGFIMFYTHRSDFRRPGAIRSFLLKRAVRIIPLYWLLTSLTIFILLFAPSIFSNGRDVDVFWFVASYLFIPFPSPSGVIAPTLGVGWTLNYEFMFYYLFAISLSFDQNKALRIITGALLSLVLIGRTLPHGSNLITFYTSWLFLDFLGGVWVAWLVLYRKPINQGLRGCLFALGLGSIAYSAYWPPVETEVSRFIIWGIPSILIVLTGYKFCIPGLGGTVLRKVGAASYSIYLSQVFALPFWAKIINYLNVRYVPFDCLVLLLTIMVIMSGIVVWIAVERPLTAFFRHKILL
ncbi:acyltransferase [Methylobacterium sp. E-005]|uniref:acyltransferase family protein n=1 Tax=Methylobacterium sp. E-005 TaxID=2836549 RepID=UPI001FB96D3A|nr:acyltransferase [Methylobacterium sp. E-005]MCJ2086923.1 acyltransferase [Methylobacterium sp. E-005]